MTVFDPSAAALPGSGAYGLPTTEDEARFVLLPVPFDATTSYRRGTADGPAAILEASRQVDLLDREVGEPYVAGIHMRELPAAVLAWNEEARAAADPVIEAAGVIDDAPDLVRSLARVNEISAKVNAWVHAEAKALLDAGKTPIVVGGDHSTPFGAIKAYAAQYPGLGVLHVDAHADLRDAYEGFAFSHASIMHNVIERIPGVAKLVQVGVRDFGPGEAEFQARRADRITCFFDADLAGDKLGGTPFATLAARIAEALPPVVYVSFDIDGLDPTLCPHTGTPVPGGLSWHEAHVLLRAVAERRRIVGFDVNEVAPGPEGEEWDANVGARLIYKLIGWTLKSEGRG
jgi:agmatinase